MKLLVTVLVMSLAGPFARALTADEFAQSFPLQTPLQRAAHAYEFCDAIFNQDSASYASTVQAIGALYASQPEPAYYMLSSCQTMWNACWRG